MEIEDLPLDSYTLIGWPKDQLQGSANSKFCRCKRGPIVRIQKLKTQITFVLLSSDDAFRYDHPIKGPPGPSGQTGERGLRGETGQQGEKGDSGNFQHLLLMLADIKYDIKALQEKVFVDSKYVSILINSFIKCDTCKKIFWFSS